VTKNKFFDDTDKENFKILSTQSVFLIDGDPVLDLYKAIDKLHILYA
jgi:hypothetical protein